MTFVIQVDMRAHHLRTKTNYKCKWTSTRKQMSLE